MPQWSRERSRDQARYPDERWSATCAPGDVAPLLRYDHHVVQVHGRPALLRTYHLATDVSPDLAKEQRIEISFTYTRGHPAAPATLQAVVDGLTFEPISGAD